MNKAKFFRYCETTAKGPDAPALCVVVEREYRGLDDIISLHGCWGNCSVLSIELYRPLPGRQGQQRFGTYRIAHERIAAALPKYQRWLDEFLNK